MNEKEIAEANEKLVKSGIYDACECNFNNIFYFLSI